MYVLGTVGFQGCRRTDRRSHPVRGALFPGFPHVSKRSESTKLRLVRCTAGIRGKIRRCGAAATLPERMKTPPVPKVRFEGRFRRVRRSPRDDEGGDAVGRTPAGTNESVRAASVRPARGRPLSAQSLALSVRSGDAYHSAIRTDCVGKTTEKSVRKRKRSRSQFSKTEIRREFRENRKSKRPPAGDLPSRILRSRPSASTGKQRTEHP